MNKKILIIICSAIIIITFTCLVLVLKNSKETITYNVSFETNGGTVINDQFVKEGEQVVKPTDPVKDGYVFIKWNYEDKTYDFSSEVKFDLILTAEWVEKAEKQTFIITFDSDGGTTIPNQVIDNGNKIQKPTDPVKEGYIFKGWTLNDEEYNFDLIVERNLSLKSKWEKMEENKPTINNNQTNNNKPKPQPTIKEYTVTFDSNGGSNVASQKIEEGNKVLIPANPTKINYAFSGWFVDDKIYDFNNIINSNITLIAKWSLYGDVSLDNKIDSLDLVELSRYISGKEEFNEIQKKVADVNLDGKVNTIDIDVLRKYIADKEGYGIQALPYNTGKEYKISYDLNGGVVKQQNISIYAEISLDYELKNPKKEGYVFSGWTGSNGTIPQIIVIIPEGTKENLVYTAHWTLYGDINQDNKIDGSDLVMISRYISGMLEFNEIQKKVADVNLDNLIDEKDTDILSKYISDKEGYGITKLPYIS